MRKIIALSLIIVLVSACTKSRYNQDGEYFHLDVNGAKLPIWVVGNLESDVILITVHGGPGDSGFEHSLAHGFQYLEEDYAVVYWDQRFSGMAQGDNNTSTINEEQFIEDTRQVVNLINHKYPGKTLFLLGHSWGGQLTAGYLGRNNHADLFNGWIDLDGSIYGDLEAQIMKEWILAQVPAKMAEPNADIEFWQFVLDYYEENPAPPNNTSAEPYQFAAALDGYAANYEETQKNNPTPYKDLIFSSMFSMGFYVDGLVENEYWVDDLNYTEELGNIEIPALMLWGELDGAVPASVADYVYDHLATDSSMKKVVKIPECSHSPHYDQPVIFYQEVKSFIETYK